MIIKNHFHKKGFALGLVLKQRLTASRKWPIELIRILQTKIHGVLQFHDRYIGGPTLTV